MLWTRARSSTPHIPAQSRGPEQIEYDRSPERLRAEAFNLIDVFRLKGGLWNAVCECGEAPHAFAREPEAWQWVTSHRCPILDQSPVNREHASPVASPGTSTATCGQCDGQQEWQTEDAAAAADAVATFVKQHSACVTGTPTA